MDKLLKKPILLTVALIIVLIIILAISNSNTTINIFAIVVLLALMALVWVKYLQEKNRPAEDPVVPITPATAVQDASNTEENLDEDIKTKTGSPCEKAGLYVCKDHPKRTVNMKLGNRFPPCRGEKKGHSTVWILKE
jgi:cell division protein ZapA (FtsZ GTPase activity inhibitor)